MSIMRFLGVRMLLLGLLPLQSCLDSCGNGEATELKVVKRSHLGLYDIPLNLVNDFWFWFPVVHVFHLPRNFFLLMRRMYLRLE